MKIGTWLFYRKYDFSHSRLELIIGYIMIGIAVTAIVLTVVRYT